MAINIAAVVVLAVIHTALGMWWYSPAGFGKQWIKGWGFSKKEVKDMQKKSMTAPIIIGILMTLVLGYVLANVVGALGVTSLVQGALVGIIMWLGFVFTIAANRIIWVGQPLKLVLIDTGLYLVTMIIGGALFATWM